MIRNLNFLPITYAVWGTVHCNYFHVSHKSFQWRGEGVGDTLTRYRWMITLEETLPWYAKVNLHQINLKQSVGSIADLDDYATAMALIGKAGATMAFAGIYLYSPELYPTDIRNVALGTASMCGRISGMIAPYVGGPMVRYNRSINSASPLMNPERTIRMQTELSNLVYIQWHNSVECFIF